MKIKNTKAYQLKDFEFYNWNLEISPQWNYEDWALHPEYYNKWISFDCLAYDKSRNRIYCGLASFEADILYTFDINTRKFMSLNYSRVADPYDAKFHKSLEIDDDGILYGAIACYHDINKQFEAKGASIIRYDPKSDTLEKLCIPIEKAYIQSIVLDRVRKKIYGFTVYPEKMFSYDIVTGNIMDIALIGSGCDLCQAHKGVIDQEGNVWGTWGRTRAWHDTPGTCSIQLFKYIPDEDRIEWYSKGVHNKSTNQNEKINSMVLGKDGLIYIGTTEGHLVRLDPKNAQTDFIGRPCNDKRLAAMAFGPDGLLYGIGGEGRAQLFAFDCNMDKIWNLGFLDDLEMNTSAAKIHDLVVTDDLIIYGGENDNWSRTSYLWECVI